MRLACLEFIIKLCEQLLSSERVIYQGGILKYTTQDICALYYFFFIRLYLTGCSQLRFYRCSIMHVQHQFNDLEECCTIFSFTLVSFHWVFLSKVFNDATIIEWWSSKREYYRIWIFSGCPLKISQGQNQGSSFTRLFCL